MPLQLEKVQKALVNEHFFDRWRFSSVHVGDGQGFEAAVFAWDRHVWSSVRDPVALLPRETAAAASPPPCKLKRTPALQLLRSTAQPKRVLALISVHADPNIVHEAMALGFQGWVRDRVVFEVAAVAPPLTDVELCIALMGDFNLAAPEGRGRGSWAQLLDGGFEPAQFAPGASRVTNLHALGRKNAAKVDHAFVSFEQAPWLVRAAARVVDVTARHYSPLAADLIALKSLEKVLKDGASLIATCVNQLQKVVVGEGPAGQGKHQKTFSDHLPISLTGSWRGCAECVLSLAHARP